MPTRSQGNLCAHCSLGGLWQEGGSALQAAHSHSVHLPVADRDRFWLLLAFGYLSSLFSLPTQSSTSTPFVLVFACTAEAERVLCVCERGRILWWNNVFEHSLVAE